MTPTMHLRWFMKRVEVSADLEIYGKEKKIDVVQVLQQFWKADSFDILKRDEELVMFDEMKGEWKELPMDWNLR